MYRRDPFLGKHMRRKIPGSPQRIKVTGKVTLQADGSKVRLAGYRFISDTNIDGNISKSDLEEEYFIE